mmetsp:Transcript_98445/g.170508  ORF Transcript_98445/g.170508 Transcript_98445/m.170508 type:complete len:263 (+) Transcript_98445:48-836(+)
MVKSSGKKSSWSWASKGTQKDVATKIKSTIGWYNKHGGLSEEIFYKQAGTCLQAIAPSKALSILHGLEEKASTIKDPTAWLQKAASRYAPDLDFKVKSTLSWYNKHGGLAQQIHFDSVKAPLSQLPVGVALEILKGLDAKGVEIRDPTNWIIGAIDKKLKSAEGWKSKRGSNGGSKGSKFDTDLSAGEGLDPKIVKTVQWYNKNGGLQEAIDLGAVASHLMQFPVKEALEILGGLDGKGSSIHHPTNWIVTATIKKSGQVKL